MTTRAPDDGDARRGRSTTGASSDAFVEGDAFEYARRTTANTTGQLTWPAARALAAFLDASDALRRAREVLELGSGNGWLGLAVLRARGARDVRVTMTETTEGGALRWLEARARANAAWGRIEGDDGARARCRALNWNAFSSDAAASDAGDAGDGEEGANADARGSARTEDETPLTADSPELADVDVVLGADLVYDDAGVVALPRVVKALLSRARSGAVFYYAHTKHRYDGMDLDFFANVSANGLTCEEVRPRGAPSPPPSPPPFETLFPDQRIAIYRIALA